MRKILLAVIVISLSCFALSAATPTVGDLISRVPDSAQVIMAVDMAALRVHPRVQAWLVEHQASWSGAEDDLNKFLSDAGLDPVKDVDLVVVASFGAGGNGKGVALVAGRYDANSLAAAMVKRGGQALEIDGVKSIMIKNNAGTEAILVALPSHEFVIVGDETSVRAVLAKNRSASNLAKREVAAGHIDLRASFWLVAVVPEEYRKKAGSSPTGSDGESESVRGVLMASGAVQQVTIQASLDANLTLRGTAIADNAENAELLRDSIKGAIAAMRLHAQSTNPELVDILRGVEVRVDGAKVSAAGSIPVALMEKILTTRQAPVSEKSGPK